MTEEVWERIYELYFNHALTNREILVAVTQEGYTMTLKGIVQARKLLGYFVVITPISSKPYARLSVLTSKMKRLSSILYGS